MPRTKEHNYIFHAHDRAKNDGTKYNSTWNIAKVQNISHLNNADGEQKGDPSGRIITEEPKARTRTRTFLLTWT